MIPRGIRNNNPGNLRWGQEWLGLVPVAQRTDPDFCQFTDPKYGVRAMAMVLRTYARENVLTVREAIERYSPPEENDDGSYVADVCAWCDVGPDQTVDLTAILVPMVTAMIHHEEGQVPYMQSDISYWVSLA